MVCSLLAPHLQTFQLMQTLHVVMLATTASVEDAHSKRCCEMMSEGDVIASAIDDDCRYSYF